MNVVFAIEDEMHAERCGEFSSYEAAMAELQRRADLPWDQAPNQCPCTGWESCERRYEIVKYDASVQPWRPLETKPALKLSAAGAVWAANC